MNNAVTNTDTLEGRSQARPATPAAEMLAFKRILAPVDFSEPSAHGLRFASIVAEEFEARLDVVHVVEPSSYPEWGYAHLIERENKLRLAAPTRLPEFTAESGVMPQLLDLKSVRLGDAPGEIVKMAEERNTDLVVMASNRVGWLSLGRTTVHVLRHAGCPVLVVRNHAIRDNPSLMAKFGIKRFLVPTDFSDTSKQALPYAEAFAQRFNATIVLVHVVPSTLPAELAPLGVVVRENRLMEGAKDLLPLFRETHLDLRLPVESHVLNGGPAWRICKAATDLECDLIVLSTHGHSGLKHLFLGSVTERVVSHAPVPVLVVREKERDLVPVRNHDN